MKTYRVLETNNGYKSKFFPQVSISEDADGPVEYIRTPNTWGCRGEIVSFDTFNDAMQAIEIHKETDGNPKAYSRTKNVAW